MSQSDNPYVLVERVRPVPLEGLDAPFWKGLTEERLVIQRCPACAVFQWGPEYVCYRCGTFDLRWTEVPRGADGRHRGVVYSWERVWHPVDPSLVESVPYVVVLVELPDTGGVRVLGNIVEPPDGPIPIGAELMAVFEHHDTYSLLQWRLRTGAAPIGCRSTTAHRS